MGKRTLSLMRLANLLCYHIVRPIMNLKSFYRKLEKGNRPQQRIVRDDDGRIQSAVTHSQRGDIIVSTHVNNDLYKSMRIMPKSQSRSGAIQDMLKNPTSTYSEDFERCQYQLLCFNCESLRKEDAAFNHRLIHERCNWNSKQATRLNTARSARSLQNAWSKYP